MVRVAWVNPTSGISGDMFLSAMVDLGADPKELSSALGTIEALDGFQLQFRPVDRGGLRALHAEVKLPGDEVHRGLSQVHSIIDRSGLSRPQKDLSKEIFSRLALAEAKVHGVAVGEVELHEVGALDAILDICGFAIAKDLLGLDQLFVSPPALGRGVSAGAHGSLAVPVPAVLELLAGKQAYGGSPDYEATTPTGAAILSAAAVFCGQMPEMTIEAVGYGAGTKDPANFPNVAQMVLGSQSREKIEAPELPGRFEEIVELQTNLDDITGELSGYLISALLAKGALDAFLTPVLAKKERPGVLLTVVASSGDAARICGEMFSLTGTLGIRSIAKQRYVLDRQFFEICILGETLSVKAGPYRAKVEFSQLSDLAQRRNVPIVQLERMVQAEIENYLRVNSIDLNHQ
ncbi:MAG: nickel pincer cofactor biosynthesis protein LarC [Actinomycetota bacterium]|nr:MAG: nickel pincer cofactor biosynthesis protein LarC [Actinomycetota bacterium]